MRRRWMGAAVLGAVMAVVTAGCLWETGYTGNLSGPKVAVMGDDVVDASGSALHAALDAGHSVRMVGIDDVTMADMQQTAVQLGSTGPQVAVVELGTADVTRGVPVASSLAGLDNILGRFAPPASAVIVTVNEHVSEAGFDPAVAHQLNAGIIARADQVADWSSAVAGNLDLYTVAPDHLVPTPAGQSLLSGLVEDAVSRCLAPASVIGVGTGLDCSHCWTGYAARSTDAGADWASSAAPDMQAAGLVHVGGALVAVGSPILGLTPLFGVPVARSLDGGATWVPATTEPSGVGVVALSAVTSTPTALVAVGSLGSGLFVARSADVGDTWTTASTVPTGNIALTAVTNGLAGLIAVGRSVTGSTSKAFVMRSTDGGDTWTAATTQPTGGSSLSGVVYRGSTLVAVGETDTSSATTAYVARSTDGGVTWSPVAAQPTGSAALAAVASNATGLLAVGESADRTSAFMTASIDGEPPGSPTRRHLRERVPSSR